MGKEHLGSVQHLLAPFKANIFNKYRYSDTAESRFTSFMRFKNCPCENITINSRTSGMTGINVF